MGVENKPLSRLDRRWTEENVATPKIIQLTGDSRLLPLKARQIFGISSKQNMSRRDPEVKSMKLFQLTGEPCFLPPKAQLVLGLESKVGQEFPQESFSGSGTSTFLAWLGSVVRNPFKHL